MEIDQSAIKGESHVKYPDTVPKSPGARRKPEAELKHPYQREWYLKNRERVLLQNKRYRQENRQKDMKRRADYHQSRKRLVLAFYGKNGEAKCCWPDCEVDDLDMLSLDHVNNDGADHRREIKQKTSSSTGGACGRTFLLGSKLFA